MEVLIPILTSVQAIVGMAATLLLLGLLGSILLEFISTILGLRSRFMNQLLMRLLEYNDDRSVYEKFTRNPLYRQHLLVGLKGTRLAQAPNYLSGNNFVSILLEVLRPKDVVHTNIPELLSSMPTDSNLRRVLQQFYNDGFTDLVSFKSRLLEWYSDIANQASGWYKRSMLYWIFFIGLTIAVTLNADTFQIFKHFSYKADNAQKIEALASKLDDLEKRGIIKDSIHSQEKMSSAINDDILALKNDLKLIAEYDNGIGIGWNSQKIENDFIGWLYRLLGWLLTAIAISLFSPLWFEVLRKFTSIRTAVYYPIAPPSSPEEKEEPTKSKK